MNKIAAVFRKELTDHLRDRRSMVSALIFPLLGPLMTAGMFTMMASWFQENKPVKIAVVGRENAPNLVGFLERHGAEISVAPKNHEEKIKDGDLDVVLVIPPGFGKDFEAGRRASVRMEMDESRNDAQYSVHRAQRLLQGYSRQIGMLRLLARGVNAEISEALDIEEVDLASSQKRAATFLNMIPMFVLLSAFIGGMHVAIDVTAGERERGSLEPLLLNPVSRWTIAIGKWSTTVLVSWLAIGVSLVGFAVAMRQVPLQNFGIRATLGTRELLGIFASLLPLSLFSASLMMLVATFARSFKEAQTYVAALQLAPMVPGMVLALSPVKPALWMMAVPAFSQELLISQVMRNEPTRPLWFGLALAASLVGAALCLGGCVRLLRHEKIVFGR